MMTCLKLKFLFFFIFKVYITVLVLPNIKMNPPQVYMFTFKGIGKNWLGKLTLPSSHLGVVARIKASDKFVPLLTTCFSPGLKSVDFYCLSQVILIIHLNR